MRLALENERLQLALRARLEEQEALRRVATVVARQHAPEEVFALVTREVARLLDADAAMTARYDAPGLAMVVADWSAPGASRFPTGDSIEIGGATALAKVQTTEAPARADTYEGMPGEYPAFLREIGMRAAVAAPIVVDGRLWGAVGAGSSGAPFPLGAERRLGAFAELVAHAIANVDARMKLDESRVRIVQAADEARRRIERDLHDGAQQRLVALALRLGILVRTAEPVTAAALEECRHEMSTALTELRELARGIHPVVLTERGLEPALQALAARSPVPVEESTQRWRTGSGRRTRRPCTSSRRRRSRTSRSTPTRTRRACTCTATTAGRRSSSATTGRAGRRPARAAACAGSPTASTRSAARSPSRARRAAGPRSAPAFPSARAEAAGAGRARGRLWSPA